MAFFNILYNACNFFYQGCIESLFLYAYPDGDEVLKLMQA